jgi:hypothetical protein
LRGGGRDAKVGQDLGPVGPLAPHVRDAYLGDRALPQASSAKVDVFLPLPGVPLALAAGLGEARDVREASNAVYARSAEVELRGGRLVTLGNSLVTPRCEALGRGYKGGRVFGASGVINPMLDQLLKDGLKVVNGSVVKRIDGVAAL